MFYSNVPHDVIPKKQTVRIVLAVKNFAAIKGVCHIGLGVTATNTVKVLRREGFYAEAWATQTAKELADKLRKDEVDSRLKNLVPVSHVIVSAPSWVQPDDFKSLCLNYPNIIFILLNHSGCAFLSIDKYGIRNIRECVDLELTVHNFRVAANNPRVSKWITSAFGGPCLLLPNLYDVNGFVNPYQYPKPLGNAIKIGSFGAGRPWKNQLVAAEAAVSLARHLGVDLEFYVNSKRPDGGERMIESRGELFTSLRGCKLVEVPWESWPRFKHTCGTMHLLFQPSFDETFNVVTADGIAAGVPSVVSDSIEWAPREWWAHNLCDPATIVKIALYLLHDANAVEDGREALTHYVNHGVRLWDRYLLGK